MKWHVCNDLLLLEETHVPFKHINAEYTLLDEIDLTDFMDDEENDFDFPSTEAQKNSPASMAA